MNITLILYLIYLITVWWYEDGVVYLHQGIIKGTKLTTRKGREIYGFLGIPYAEPPVKDLRFRSPVAKKSWSGILGADKSGDECLQYSSNKTIKGSEDCLYLNVYTPWISEDKELLPVMVYVPGGAYVTGSGNIDAIAPDYLLDKDVILVSMNYRLGIFGFLSTGDLASPGNYGLKDQLLALQWVQENIRAFRGNPNKVTLFGESAGGCSVNLHALCDKSKDLFHQYIIQSGPALSAGKFRYPKSYQEKTKTMASRLNCTRNDTFEMVDCLRQLDSEELLSTLYMYDYLNIIGNAAWGPTIEPDFDGAFISKNPAQLIMENKMKDCPFITGTVKDEGSLVTNNLYTNSSTYDLFTNYPNETVIKFLDFAGPFPGDSELTDTLIKYYLENKPVQNKDSIIREYQDLFSDMLFLYPQYKTMEYIAEYREMAKRKYSMYVYSFEYRGRVSGTSTIRNNTNIGVAHADDLFYLFPCDSRMPNNLTRSEKDFEVVDLMVDLWTSFAQTGVPHSSLLNEKDKWQPYAKNKNVLRIGSNGEPNAILVDGYFQERMDFWENVAPNYPEIPEIRNSL